jgi:hypothetical protein
VPYRHIPQFPHALLPGARDRRRSFTSILLAGDRGFESASLQRRVVCEPGDDAGNRRQMTNLGFGFLLTAVSMWQMSCFSLQMGMAPVIIFGLLQGFGLGCTQVPLSRRSRNQTG